MFPVNNWEKAVKKPVYYLECVDESLSILGLKSAFELVTKLCLAEHFTYFENTDKPWNKLTLLREKVSISDQTYP